MTDQTVTSTIWIPLLRVLLTGGLFVLVIVTWFNMQNRVSSWSIGFFFGSLLSFVYWAFSSFNKTTVIETVEVEPVYPNAIEHDFDAPMELWDVSRGENYPRVKRVKPPIPPKKMRKVADKYLRLGKFTHGVLEGTGKPLTRSEYDNLLAYLLENRLAKEDNPGVKNTTITLTHWGENMMKAYGTKGRTHTHTRYTQESEA